MSEVMDGHLAAGAPGSPAGVGVDGTDLGGDRPLLRLQRAIEQFNASYRDSVISAGRMISPLLDLWSLAVAVDRAAAAPIEALLKVLVLRTTTTSAELSACTDAVRAAVAGLSPTPYPITV